MAKDFSSQQVVEGYDQHIRKLISGYEVVHQQIQALLKTYLPESAHILVVGCGTGYELGYLLQTFPNWHFTATDLSAAMLDKARTSLQDLNVDHRVDFHLGDVHELENIVSFDADDFYALTDEQTFELLEQAEFDQVARFTQILNYQGFLAFSK